MKRHSLTKAMRAPWISRPTIELLENRQLLAANILASLDAEVAPDASTILELTVQTDSPVVLGVRVTPLDEGLDPAAPRLLIDGEPISTTFSTDDIGASEPAGYVLAELNSDEVYSLSISDEAGGSGPFRVEVVLPGDPNGDGTISNDEIVHASAATVQSQFGGNHVSALFFRQRGFHFQTSLYNEDLDTNFDGVIDAFDLGFIEQNAGSTAVSVQLIGDEEGPTIVATISPDTGNSDVDGLTNSVVATIGGTVTDNFNIAQFAGAVDGSDPSTFLDLFGDDFLGPQDPTTNLEWSLSIQQLELLAGGAPGSLFDNGPHTLFLTATDELGNPTETPFEFQFEIDTIAPPAPGQPVLVGGGDEILNDNTPILSVDATEDDVLIQLFSSLVEGPIGQATGSGTLTITTSELPDGAHQITATATDAADNESLASIPLQLSIDQGAPGLSDFRIVPETSETDTQGNPVTPESVVTLTGRTEAGATVALQLDGQELQSTTSDSQGDFSFNNIALNFGTSTFQIVSTDIANNTSTFDRTITRDAKPRVDSPVGPLALDEDDPSQQIDLSTVFIDPDVGDGDTLTFSVVNDNPTVIMHSLEATTLTLTPQADQSGMAQITVRATDSLGVFVEDSISIDIRAINDAPIANVPPTLNVAAGGDTRITSISITDVDAGPQDQMFVTLEAADGLLSITRVGGVLFTFGDGSRDPTLIIGGPFADVNESLKTLIYEPNADFTGQTTLTVRPNDAGNTGAGGDLEDFQTIEISVIVDDAPVAINDEFNTNEDTTVSGNVLVDNGNGADSDPDGDDSALQITNAGTITTALSATVTLSTNGDFTYDPTLSEIVQSTAEGESRIDLFEYVVSDGTSTSVGIVTINVTGVNDLPILNDDDFATTANTPLAGNLFANNGAGADTDIDGTLTITNTGSLTTNLGAQATISENGDFTYDPVPSEALQTIPSGQTLVDFFEFGVSDGFAIATSRANITVSPSGNAPPVALGDTIQVDMDTADNVVLVLDNDRTDLGETLTITEVGTPSEGGSARIADDGLTVFYSTPDDFLGIDRFSYTISDGEGGTDQGLVTVQVSAGQAALEDHIHATMSVFVNGQRVDDPPANIGVIEGGFTSEVHTHDADGRIHIHPVNGLPRTEPSTLGDFFETWRTNAGIVENNPDAIFNENQIYGNTVDDNHVIRMFVNGVPNFEFENYIPENEDIIDISYEPIMASGTPEIVPIGDVTLLAGAPLLIPLDGFDFEGQDLTFSATSSDPDLLTTSIPEGNRSFRINVAEFGDMVFELFDGHVRRVTDAIAGLANDGIYDGVIFHRIIETFVIQGGDPTGTGFGDPSIPDFDDQFHVDLQHTSEGILSMAKTNIDDTNSSQFFITAFGTRSLDFNHSVFGRLIEGENVRRAVAQVPVGAGDRPITDVVMDTVDVFFDTENAVLILSAPEGASGEADVTITVEDTDQRTSSRTFTVTVEPDPQNGGPFLEDIPEVRTTTDMAVEIELRAVDVEGDTVVFDASPSGTIDFNVAVDDDTDDDHTAIVIVTPPSDFTGVLELEVEVRPEFPSDTGRGLDPDSQIVQVFVDPPPSALLADLGTPLAANAPVSTLSANDPVLDELAALVIATWEETLGSETDLEVTLDVRDLDDQRLAESSITQFNADGLPTAGLVTIDTDANGLGWHVDANTLPPADQFDLYTVLLHEVGHVLGITSSYPGFNSHLHRSPACDPTWVDSALQAVLDSSAEHLNSAHHADDLMNATLSAGERRLPSELDSAIVTLARSHASELDDPSLLDAAMADL